MVGKEVSQWLTMNEAGLLLAWPSSYFIVNIGDTDIHSTLHTCTHKYMDDAAHSESFYKITDSKVEACVIIIFNAN